MKYIFSKISILLSLICLIASIVINYQIALRYLAADGKTRALFSIIEIANFSYKYYLIIPAVAATVLSIIAFKKREAKNLAFVSLILSIVAITCIILRIWTLMVYIMTS